MASRVSPLGACVLMIGVSAARLDAGNLTPPGGPVTATMKTLDQVEPRTNVQTLPGSGTAVFVISQPGSYYLTADVVGQAGKHGIQITALTGVTIDLRGFNVRSSSIGLDGINAAGDAAVLNGTVSGWANNGVNICQNALVEHVRVSGNLQAGIQICRGTAVECVAQQNLNGFIGFGGLFRGCTSTSNSDAGFIASNGSSVIQCNASGNARGVAASGGSQITNCTIFASTGNGVELADGCSLWNNVIQSNANNGISITGNENSIDANHLRLNGTALRVTSVRNWIVHNNARGNTTGYVIAAGNDYGLILSGPGANFSSSAAWANFVDAAPAPTCSDGIQNGSETDVDCGGGTCPTCANGKHCIAGSDCASHVCTGGVCQAATCSDGVKNGNETGVDCGGGTCPTCPNGQGCNVNSDCSSGHCVGGVCVP